MQGASANYTLDSDKVLNISGVRTFPVFVTGAFDGYDLDNESNMSIVLADFDGEIYGESFKMIGGPGDNIIGVANASLKTQYETLGRGYTIWHNNSVPAAQAVWGTYINSSSFLAFHLLDEGAQNAAYYQAQYTATKANFPNKLILLNHYGKIDGVTFTYETGNNAFWEYSRPGISDILNWDTYSIGYQSWYFYRASRPNMSTYGLEHKTHGSWFGGDTNKSKMELANVSAPVWMWIQSMKEGQYYAPTAQEMRSSTYTALTMNVMGIVYYMYNAPVSWIGYDSWGLEDNTSRMAEASELARELHSFNSWITLPTKGYRWDCNSLGSLASYTCSNTSVSVTFSPDPIVTLYNETKALQRDAHKLNYRLHQNTTSNKTYLIVMNKDPLPISDLTVTVGGLSGSMNATTLGLKTTGSQAYGRNLSVINGVFNDSFDGYAVHIYQISTTSSSSGIPANQFIINASGGNATWQESSVGDGTLLHNDGHIWISDKLMDYVAYWDFQESTGLTVIDLSSNHNNGTITNASWTNPGLYINGSIDKVNISNSSSTFLTSAISFTATIQNTTSVSAANGAYIASKYDTTSLGRGWRFFIDVNGWLNIATGTTDCSAIGDITTASSLPNNGSLTSVGFGWSNPGNITIWKDGVQTSYSAQSTRTTNLCGSNRSLWLGAYRAGALNPYNGTYYRAKLFNRALSATEWLDEQTKPFNVSGNRTVWHNWTDGNVTYQVVVNATTPANTNYTVHYRTNGTGAFTQLGGTSTGNNMFPITAQYQNTDVRVVMNGNETATPELIAITYYSQAAATSDPSTPWIYGIEGEFFQNKTIGSNKTCINQGDGAIGVCKLADNFNDNNTVGWTQAGTGTIYVNKGVLEQTIDSSWLHKNTTSYENISMFAKFKATYLLSDFDISQLRGNLSRDNGFYQFAVGGSTWNSTRLSLYNSSSWITINNTQRKNREVNVWNYTYSKIYGDILELYIGTSYSNALLFVQASGTNSFYKNGTVIKFGGYPNSESAIMSWDEIRAVELDALGNQYLSGNYSMNYTVPASQYAKNITINGTYPSGTNYSLKYRQNATGDYVAVEGIKTTDATIELPTPYYQSIDILLEMNSTESDTLWIQNIIVGTYETNGRWVFEAPVMNMTPIINPIITPIKPIIFNGLYEHMNITFYEYSKQQIYIIPENNTLDLNNNITTLSNNTIISNILTNLNNNTSINNILTNIFSYYDNN